MRALASTFLVVLLALAACTSGGDNTKSDSTGSAATTVSPSGGGSADCVEGTWKMEENGVTRMFTFKADGSGEEVYAPDDVRPFTWASKDASTVHIVYTPHGDTKSTEWDLAVDCAAGTVSFGGAKYRK